MRLADMDELNVPYCDERVSAIADNLDSDACEDFKVLGELRGCLPQDLTAFLTTGSVSQSSQGPQSCSPKYDLHK